jgi:YVTN family beta-propeller protein
MQQQFGESTTPVSSAQVGEEADIGMAGEMDAWHESMRELQQACRKTVTTTVVEEVTKQGVMSAENTSQTGSQIRDTEAKEILTAEDQTGAAEALEVIKPKERATQKGTVAYVTNRKGNSVSVIDVATQEVLFIIPVGKEPVDVALTPDGTKAYVMNMGSNNISIIETVTDKVLATTPVGKSPRRATMTPDGTKAYVTNKKSNNISVIETATDKVLATVSVGEGPWVATITPDGTKAYVMNKGSNNISVIETTTAKVLATIPVGENPARATMTPDGTKAYVVNYGSNNVSVIETTTAKVLTTILVGEGPWRATMTPDGTKVYVVNYGSRNVSVIETATAKVLATIPVGKNPGRVTMTPDGTKAYVVNRGSNNVSVIETATDKVLATIPVEQAPHDVAFITFLKGQALSESMKKPQQMCNETVTVAVNAAFSVQDEAAKWMDAWHDSMKELQQACRKTVITAVEVASFVQDEAAKWMAKVEKVTKQGVMSTESTSQTGSQIRAWFDQVNQAVERVKHRLQPVEADLVLYVVAGPTEVKDLVGAVAGMEKIVTQIDDCRQSVTHRVLQMATEQLKKAYLQMSQVVKKVQEILEKPYTTPDMITIAKDAQGIVRYTVKVITEVQEILTAADQAAATKKAAKEGGRAAEALEVIKPKERAKQKGTVAYVVNAESNSVSVINVDTQKVWFTIPVGKRPLRATMTPDRTKAYVVNEKSNNISIIETATDKVLATIPVGEEPVDIAFTPDGTKAYVVNSLSNNVSVVETATHKVLATIPVGELPQRIAITPDRTKVYVVNYGSNNVSVIETATAKVLATIPVGEGPYDVAITPDGTKAYIANHGSNNVSVIETATDKVLATIPVGKRPWRATITPDGKKAYVVNCDSNSVSVIETATDKVLATIPVGKRPWRATITPDGKKAYVMNHGSNSVSVIETTADKVSATIPVGEGPWRATITPDGKKAYVVNCDSNSVSVIETATDKVLATIPVEQAPHDVAFITFLIGKALSGSMKKLQQVCNETMTVAVRAAFSVRGEAGKWMAEVGELAKHWARGSAENTLQTDSQIREWFAQINQAVKRVVKDQSQVNPVSFSMANSIKIAEDLEKAMEKMREMVARIDNYRMGTKQGTVLATPTQRTISENDYVLQLAVEKLKRAYFQQIETAVEIVIDTQKRATKWAKWMEHSSEITVNPIAEMVEGILEESYTTLDTVAISRNVQTIVQCAVKVMMNAANQAGEEEITAQLQTYQQIEMAEDQTTAAEKTAEEGRRVVVEAKALEVVKPRERTKRKVTVAYVVSGGSVSVIDIATWEVLSIIRVGESPSSVAFAPDGTRAYVTNTDSDNVSVIDTAIDEVVVSIPVGKRPHSIAITPDRSQAYVVVADNVCVINTDTKQVLTSIPVGESPSRVAITADGTKAYVTNWGSNNVSVIDIAARKVLTTIPVGESPSGVAITPDGKKVYVANHYSSNVSVIDIATQQVLTTIPVVGKTPSGVAITPDGKKVYVVNSGSNNPYLYPHKLSNGDVSVIDTATYQVLASIAMGRSPDDVAITPDGTQAYVVDMDKVNVIDTVTQNVLTVIRLKGFSIAITSILLEEDALGEEIVLEEVALNKSMEKLLEICNETMAISKDAFFSVLNEVTDPQIQEWVVDQVNQIAEGVLLNQPQMDFASLMEDSIEIATWIDSYQMEAKQEVVLATPKQKLTPVVTYCVLQVAVEKLKKAHFQQMKTAVEIVAKWVDNPSESLQQKIAIFIVEMIMKMRILEESHTISDMTTMARSVQRVVECTVKRIAEAKGILVQMKDVYRYQKMTTKEWEGLVQFDADERYKVYKGKKEEFSDQIAEKEDDIAGLLRDQLKRREGVHAQLRAYQKIEMDLFFTESKQEAEIKPITMGNARMVAIKKATDYALKVLSESRSMMDIVSRQELSTIQVRKSPMENAKETATEDERVIAAKTSAETREGSEQKVKVAYVVNSLSDSISVVDTATQQVLSTIPVGESPIDVKFTPDGTKAYVTNGGSDNVSVIDTATQQVLATLPMKKEPMSMAMVSMKFRKVEVNYVIDRCYIGVIDNVNRKVLTIIPVGKDLRDVAFTPDGIWAYVVNLGSDNVNVINIPTQQVTIISVGEGPCGAVFTPDGTKAYVVNSFSNDVSVIDTATQKVLVTIPVGESPRGVAFTPDGIQAYVVNSYSRNVSVIDTVTQKVLVTIPVEVDYPEDVFFDSPTPDETRAYVTSSLNHYVSVINTATQQLVTTAPETLIWPNRKEPIRTKIHWWDIVQTVVLDTIDVIQAYVTNAGSNDVSVIDTVSQQVLATIPVGENPMNVAFTPDGTQAYVVNAGSNEVSVIDTSKRQVVAIIPVGQWPCDVAFTPNGTWAYVTNADDNNVSVINTAAIQQVMATISVGKRSIGVEFTPDGTQAYVVDLESNDVSVIDTAIQQMITTIPVGEHPMGVAFTPNGTHAYVVNHGSNNVSVIHTAPQWVFATIPVGQTPFDIAFTPDGTWAYVTNNDDNSISVIKTATRQVSTTIPMENAPRTIAFHPYFR